METRPVVRTARSSVLFVLAVVSLAGAPRLAPIAAHAQTWEAVRMAPGMAIQDICMLPGGTHGWAVGSGGSGGLLLSYALRTTDGGAHWVPLSLPNPTGVSLYGVCFVNETTGWLVGASGLIYKTTNGGDTWTQQASGTSRRLSKVCFVDADRGWITGGWQDGSSYLVLRTINGGTTWENRSFGTSCYSCDDIVFADGLNGWIGGYDSALNAHVHHSNDGGLNWVRQPVPVSGTAVVSSIDFASNKVGWATISSLYQTPAGAILSTVDGGFTWTIQGYTGLHYNYCIDAQDTQRAAIAAVQILSPVQEKVFLTGNGGLTWTPQAPPIVNYTYAIQYVGTHLWVGADFGQILGSLDDGVTWDWEYRAPLWRSLAWSSPASAWLTAGSQVGTDGYCLRSEDGGHTWWRDASAPGGAQVQFLDADTGWMLWEGNSASVWRTTDAGLHWSRSFVGTSSWIGWIWFASATRGWACGASGTLRVTQDGGATWSPQSLGTTAYVQRVAFVDPEEGWAVGGYGGGNGFIRHTVNGGVTWVAQTPAVADHFQAACFTDKLHGWLGAVGGRVHRTANGGQTWEIAGQVGHTYIDDLVMQDLSEGWLAARNPAGGGAGEDGRGFIYRTINGGATWTLEWSGPWARSSISDLALREGTQPWACGYHDTMLRLIDPAAAGDAPVAWAGGQAWPNPFASSTTLRCDLAQPGAVQLVICDLLGRRVRTLLHGQHAAGPVMAVWDGRDDHGRALPGGIYFGRIEAGPGSRTMRVCLAR